MHSVLLISLDCPADFEGLSGFRMCMDEVHNVYLYIGGTMVVPLVEMMSNRIFEIFTNDVEVALKSVHKSMLCLSNILDFACFARHAVY